MKKIFKYFLGSIFLVVFVAALSSCFGYSMSEKRKIAYKIIDQLSNSFKEKYNLRLAGISEAAPEGKYRTIGIELYSSQILSKDQGRDLLIKCAEEMLESINSSEEFRQYLEDVPFTGDNIIVNIHVQPKDNPDVYYPEITVFSFYNNTLTFKTYSLESEKKFQYHTKEKETLEEAMKIVESQKRDSSN